MGAVAVALDPVYGHRVGTCGCQVDNCKGHRADWEATIHRLYEEFYTSTRRLRRLRRQEKDEASIVASKGQRRVKGLAPRNTTVKAEVKVETPLTEAYKVLLPKKKNYHYHLGKSGRCSCEKGDDRK